MVNKSTYVVVSVIVTTPSMMVGDYLRTGYFDARSFAARSQRTVQDLRDSVGRTRNSTASASDRRWNQKLGMGMRPTVTVGMDAKYKWIRVIEEEIYQMWFKEPLDRLSLMFGESKPMPEPLPWD